MNRSIIESRKPRWWLLALGTMLTVIGGLGVHVVLQQTLHVPHPSNYPSHVFLEQVDQGTIVAGLLLLLSWSSASLGRLGFVARWLVLFCVYAMLRESLRATLMEGIVTTAYAYPFLALIPRLLEFLVLTLLCVIAQPRLPRFWQKVLGAGVIYAAVAFVAQPLIGRAFQGMLTHLAYLQHDEVYPMPYGAHVLIPAYITFIEPAVACIFCAAFVWQGLSKRTGWKYLQFVFLLLLLRRSLFPPFIYALYQPQARMTALASAGQFSLETVALALLAALTWRYAGARVAHP